MKVHTLPVILACLLQNGRVAALNPNPSKHRTLRQSSLTSWLAGVDGDVEDMRLVSGEDIWNQTLPWATFGSQRHAGINSNVYNGALVWNGASFLSLRKLFAVSMVTYPIAGVVLVILLTMVVGMCLNIKPEVISRMQSNEDGVSGDLSPSVAIQIGDLTPGSQRLFAFWELFCRALPCLFVFGSPMLLLFLNKYMPQEVLTSLCILTSFMLFMNGVYMATYGGQGMRRLLETEAHFQAKQRAGSSTALAEEVKAIVHWVILPQYKEDVEVISMTLRSIAQSPMARNIGVLLAMEEREAAAPEKAEALQQTFGSQLGEVQACYHPANLLNDPAGKASNSAFAFHWLVQYLNLDANFFEGDSRIEIAREQVASCSLEGGSRLGWQGNRPVVLTVADADSEFHSDYFEGLAWAYLEAGAAKQDLHIWQSPIFHVKNYATQPAPVKVGSVFTAIHELATLSDPCSVKLPYSTYSFSLRLARNVGGWDPEWIAEDWHMGIKCFLYTMGQCTVQPLYFPTCNYTPEDSSYVRTIHARWIQMKRHALGFSDFSYYFMMLPLVFSRACRVRSKNALQKFWNMSLYGTALMFKLVNVHVMVGLVTGYSTMQTLLKGAMILMLPEQRHIEELFDWTNEFRAQTAAAAVLSIVVVAGLFVLVYDGLKRYIDGVHEGSRILHWLKILLYFCTVGIFFFYGVGVASWLAALNVLVSRSFKYEVALKPSLTPAKGPKLAGGS